MTTTRYSIPEIHARSILSTARKIEDGFHFSFDASDPSKEHLVTYTQQADCPMFYQAMLALGKKADSNESFQRTTGGICIHRLLRDF